VQNSKAYESYLVGVARLGDGNAFEKLVAFRGPSLFAHAFRLLGDREEARDAVQEAWVEITKGFSKLKDDAAFPTWAYRIVSRCCARQIGRNINARNISQTPPAAPEPDFYDAGSVRAAIDRLPPKQAATIRLFYIEEFNLREVAIAMDVPEGTVKSRLSSARNHLKTYLKGYENA